MIAHLDLARDHRIGDVRRIRAHHIHGARQVTEGLTRQCHFRGVRCYDLQRGSTSGRCGSVLLDIALGPLQRGLVLFNEKHRGPGGFQGEGESDDSASRTQVHRRSARGVTQRTNSGLGDQFGLRPWDEHTGSHRDLESTKSSTPGDVLQGNAREASGHCLFELHPLRRAWLVMQEEPTARNVEHPRHQPRGIGLRRRDPRTGESAFGVVEKVANRLPATVGGVATGLDVVEAGGIVAHG